ncbi:MAG: response regulator [Candidatus Helarchaeota archaeon]
MVDDDDSLRIVYKELLELNGFKIVDTARNGEEAIQILKKMKVPPDVIVMDHRMPIMSGIQATKEITKMNKNINIIFASADSRIKNFVFKLGVKDFLLKPFSCKRLISSIKHVMR